VIAFSSRNRRFSEILKCGEGIATGIAFRAPYSKISSVGPRGGSVSTQPTPHNRAQRFMHSPSIRARHLRLATLGALRLFTLPFTIGCDGSDGGASPKDGVAVIAAGPGRPSTRTDHGPIGLGATLDFDRDGVTEIAWWGDGALEIWDLQNGL
jgi:hypothetical protein